MTGVSCCRQRCLLQHFIALHRAFQLEYLLPRRTGHPHPCPLHGGLARSRSCFCGALHPCLCLPSSRFPCGGVSALCLCLPSCAGIFTSYWGLPSPSLVDSVSNHAHPFVAMPWPFTRSFAAAHHAPVYLLATTSRLRAWSHLVPRAPTPQA